jgi:putrescine aminotransferase
MFKNIPNFGSIPGESILEHESPTVAGDPSTYNAYGRLVNHAYPFFLKKMGLNCEAVKAEGAVITDADGKMYIDCVGGYGVANVGHNHPVVVQALIEQLLQGTPPARPFITQLPVRLAEALSMLTGGRLACSFVCNSGSEAVDTALKLARLQSGRKKIIAARGSFHGYTCGALSASGIAAFKRPFEPLLPGMHHVPFGDITALERMISDDTAAVLLEPVQHEAGITLPPPGYFEQVRRLCSDRGCLLILDEIKTGLGKTGRMLGCNHFGVTPDVLLLGKSLGGGLVPVGALLADAKLWKKFGLSFSMSASSYAWNALACRAGLAVLGLLEDGSLSKACAENGRFLLAGMQSLAVRYPKVLKGAAGLGLLLGLEAVNARTAAELSRELIADGILALTAFGNASVLMFEPPLVLSAHQAGAIIQALEKSCTIVSGKAKGDYAGL